MKPQPSKNGLQPVPHIRKYCGLNASVNEMLQGTGSRDLAMRDIVNPSVFSIQRMKAGASPLSVPSIHPRQFVGQSFGGDGVVGFNPLSLVKGFRAR